LFTERTSVHLAAVLSALDPGRGGPWEGAARASRSPKSRQALAALHRAAVRG